MSKSLHSRFTDWLPGLQDKVHLDSKRRFVLLLVFFNGLLIVILLLSVRNQEIRRRIRQIEQQIIYRVEQIATIQADQIQVVYITATPAHTPVALVAATSTPTEPTLALQTSPTAVPSTKVPSGPTPTHTTTVRAMPTQTSNPTRTVVPTVPPQTPATPTQTPVSQTSTPVPPSPTPTWTSSPLPRPRLSRIELAASDQSILADGKSTAQVRATVYDQFDDPYLEEVLVTFSTDMGSFWGSSTVAVTTREGRAEATLTSAAKTGIANVRAQVDGAADQIDIAFAPGRPHSMTLTADPAQPTVRQTATLEAVVRDEFGNRVLDGTLVHFETTLGALGQQDVQTQAGTARTTVSSDLPGEATVTAQADQATAMVLLRFVSPLSLTQVFPESGCNETPADITIVGSGFASTASVALGSWALDSEWMSSSTLRAVVPPDIAAGTYDLIVRTSEDDWATLADAYTVRNCGSFDPPLDGVYLGISGAEPGFAPGQGDDDQIQVLFLEVPDGTSDSLYVRLYDADCHGAHDVQNGKAWDTPFTFTVYGGPGAYTHPDARSAHPTEGAYAGDLLASVQTTDISTDAQWYNLGPFAAGDGELVNGKRLFKLTVIGGPQPPFEPGVRFADVNVYGVVSSTSDAQNIPPEGSRMLAFSWTFVIPRDIKDRSPRLYPYIGSNTQVLIQHNWDYDRFNHNAGMTMITPQRTIDIAYDSVSGDNEIKSTAHDTGEAERNTTWATRCWAETVEGLEINLVTFWATDQSGQALSMFARSTTVPPP